MTTQDPARPTAPSEKNLNYRVMMLFNAVWCSLFCLIGIFLLKVRPAKPLDSGFGSGIGAKLLDYSTIGWRRTFNTIKSLKNLRHFRFFILAFLVFSDAVSTLSTQAAVFASVELKAGAIQILLAIIMMSFFAIFSCVIFVLLNTRCKLSQKSIITITLLVMSILPLWAYVGVTSMMEFFGVALTFGLVTGGKYEIG